MSDTSWDGLVGEDAMYVGPLFSPVRVFSVWSELSFQVVGADALAFTDRYGSTSWSVSPSAGC